MAVPTINSATAVQINSGNNPGGVTRSSVLVTVNITAGTTVDVITYVSVDGGSNYLQATQIAPGLGTNLSSGTSVSKIAVISLPDTFTNQSLSPYTGSGFRVRVRVRDHTVTTDYAESTITGITLDMTPPASVSVSAVQYVGQSGSGVLTFAHDGSGVYYKSSTSLADVDYNGNATLATLTSGATAGTIAFGSQLVAPDGLYTVYARVFDQWYNQSSYVTTTTYLLRTPPSSPRVRIIGSVGNSDYTGFSIDSNGAFTPDRNVTLRLAATSPKALKYRIRTTSNVEPTITVNGSPVNLMSGAYLDLTPANSVPIVKLTTSTAATVNAGLYNTAGDNYNKDELVFVTVDFQDAAGNVAVVSGSIVLNTKLFQANNTPMRRPDATYRLLLKEAQAGNVEALIPESVTLSDDPIRSWKDIFYPTSHGYPVDVDGNLDAATAAGVLAATSNYDPVANTVSNVPTIIYDDDNRPITVSWTNNGTKDYGNMLTSTVNNIVYWVLDNTGHGDYQLEFEHFHLNPAIYGPPYNPLAAHDGDVLVVYDATAAGALTTSTDALGNDIWVLDGNPATDSSLFKELMAFGGSGSSVVDRITGRSVNANQNGGFTTDYIRGVDKVVLVLYTDVFGTGSGFKLKAGKARAREWRNYDVDYTNGRVWIHKYVSSTDVNGLCGSTEKRLVYDWLDGNVTALYEQGRIEFDVPPSGGEVVTADYSYYDTEDTGVNTFIGSWDDQVEYTDAVVYVIPSGTNEITDLIRTKVYEDDGYGRMTTHTSWDKDRGLLTIDDGYVPYGLRLVADYYHHTYLRITPDGHGDLLWHDPILVADTTPVYPSHTWQDLKIVNEGSARLEAWKAVFTARGYNTDSNLATGIGGTNTVVDQVLDINRPWDVQKGTVEETYNRMAVQCLADYLWSPTITLTEAATILSTYKGATVSFNLEARSHCYGRAVWVLGGPSGSSFPETSLGEKRTSIEVDGKYYPSAN